MSGMAMSGMAVEENNCIFFGNIRVELRQHGTSVQPLVCAMMEAPPSGGEVRHPACFKLRETPEARPAVAMLEHTN